MDLVARLSERKRRKRSEQYLDYAKTVGGFILMFALMSAGIILAFLPPNGGVQ